MVYFWCKVTKKIHKLVDIFYQNDQPPHAKSYKVLFLIRCLIHDDACYCLDVCFGDGSVVVNVGIGHPELRRSQVIMRSMIFKGTKNPQNVQVKNFCKISQKSG